VLSNLPQFPGQLAPRESGASRIRLIAQAEAEAIRMKAQALSEVGGAYLDLKRLELAPELTAQVASALQNSQFVNFGGGGGSEHGAVSNGSDDVLRVVQTLMAAQVITGNGGIGNNSSGSSKEVRSNAPGVPPVRRST
jgi:flotillin